MVKTKSSPSRTNQIGTTCGRPSWRVVASFPVRVPSLTKARHSASSMSRGIGRRYRAKMPGMSGPIPDLFAALPEQYFMRIVGAAAAARARPGPRLIDLGRGNPTCRRRLWPSTR